MVFSCQLETFFSPFFAFFSPRRYFNFLQKKKKKKQGVKKEERFCSRLAALPQVWPPGSWPGNKSFLGCPFVNSASVNVRQ